MPEGMRNLGAVSLRYIGQVNAYLFLLTDRYPDPAPAVATAPATSSSSSSSSRRPLRRASPTTAGIEPGLSRTVRILAVALAAVAWLVCASLLLRTAVPSGLHLAHVDADAVFGKAVVEEAVRVERFFLVNWVLRQVALFATLWVYARRGARFARESAAGPIGTGMLLGMLGLGLVWLVQLPFRLLDVWWARRHDLTEAGYLEWAFGHWFELGGAFVSICVALLVVMFLARRLGEIWWIPGAVVFVAIGALFAFVSPTSSRRARSTTRPCGARRRFERQQGVSGIPVSVEDVSGTTSQANAYAVGFGASRKVVLWSTMLDGTLLRRGGEGRARPRDRAPLEQPHPEGARVVRAVRAARRLDPDARHPAPRRDGRGRSGPPRAPRRRSAAARRCCRPRAGSAGAWRQRPTGRRWRRPATRPPPAGSSSGSARPRSPIPTRPRGRTCCSRTTPRSPSASRWPKRGGGVNRRAAP